MKLATLILFLVLSPILLASHIVGGDMYYEHISGDSYRITVVLFRDCASSGAAYDDPMYVTIYDANLNQVTNVAINFPGSSVLPVILNNPCVTPPTGICTEKAVYTTVVNLPPSVNGYHVSYQRCCRGPAVSNIVSPEDNGLTLTLKIPGTNLNAVINSSPVFDNYPPLVICNNDELVFDHSATDPDGDSLVYSLVTPLAGASDFDPAPNPIPAPPYSTILWSGGYSAANPLGPGASISIHPKTGQLNADPELLGLFVVGIRVSEYRNGILIGNSDRDFLFKVVNCVITLKADITPQIESSTFISVCQGFTTVFENQGFGGTNYFWDFGVDGITTDVSTAFEPTYTYPGPGVYEVMLVVNPGWPCTDTSYQIFELYEEMNLAFTVEDSVCIQGNSLDFYSLYEGPSNPTLVWDFGTTTSPPTASTMDVMDVTFPNAGLTPVTITADNGTCHATYTDYIFLYDIPTINFGIDEELKCAPYEAHFLDSSISYANLSYAWDFGDGSFSTQPNPTHTYAAPGVYDVSLSITADEGCLIQLTLTKDNLIQVFDSPVSAFTSDQFHTDVFNPFFNLTDLSSGGKTIYYIIDDTIVNFEINPELSFSESGSHLIEQVIINQYGCPDTSFLILQIDPFTTIYVPNTFTPDGNKFNNVFKPIIFDQLDYELTIYNRWGELIFKSSDTQEHWDGTFKGNDCPDGIYGYKIKLLGFRDGKEVYTGFVNLLR